MLSINRMINRKKLNRIEDAENNLSMKAKYILGVLKTGKFYTIADLSQMSGLSAIEVQVSLKQIQQYVKLEKEYNHYALKFTNYLHWVAAAVVPLAFFTLWMYAAANYQ